ncbi:hypothetical protein BDV96DRAFT_280757 [Lophiotrema nucula]|uniref:Uncharacterized protein n=1 Tax=Lophiotrema nucula TaxID=690887 RepID=A0A6A5ZPU5_9PLEO|nr:hypothetical protein BDV96DRAFT_280757 [Lophiotrema nucula]
MPGEGSLDSRWRRCCSSGSGRKQMFSEIDVGNGYSSARVIEEREQLCGPAGCVVRQVIRIAAAEFSRSGFPGRLRKHRMGTRECVEGGSDRAVAGAGRKGRKALRSKCKCEWERWRGRVRGGEHEPPGMAREASWVTQTRTGKILNRYQRTAQEE